MTYEVNVATTNLTSSAAVQILESMTDGFFALDHGWRFTYLNAEAERLLMCRREELLGKNLWDEFPHAVESSLFREYHRAMDESVTVSFEEYYPDPLYAWFEVRGYPAPDGISVYFRNVTARKAAETALHRSEEEYRTLFETMNQGVVYLGGEGRIISVNPAAERILGQSRDQLLGRSPVTHPWLGIKEDGSPLTGDDHPTVTALRTGKPVHNYVVGVFNPVLGQTRWLLANAVPQFRPGEDRPYQVYSVFDDITDRQRAQDELLANEQRYRDLIESVPQLVWIADLAGEITYLNQQWREFTGYAEEQIRAMGWPKLVAPDDRPHVAAVWKRAIGSGESQHIEFRLRACDGSYRWFLARGVPVRDSQGQVAQWFGTCTDIHEQKESEQTQAFLAGLGEAITRSSDAEAALWEVVTRLGELMSVSRCAYADIDEHLDQSAIRRDYCRGVPSIAGARPRGPFADAVTRDLKDGKTVVVSDTRTDPRTSAQYERAYGPLAIRAFISVPMLRRGRQVASLSVQQADTPRQWTGREVALLEAVAERTHLAVENARLQRDLQQEALRQRVFLRDVLASVTEGHLILCDQSGDLPPVSEPASNPIPLTLTGGLRDLRGAVKEAGATVNFSPERANDLMTAASEAGMNAIVHVGEGTGQVFADKSSGTVQVRITDHGPGIALENLPNATLLKGYTTAGTLGHGMKLMLQTADRIFLLTGPSGTTVVIEQDQVAKSLIWFGA